MSCVKFDLWDGHPQPLMWSANPICERNDTDFLQMAVVFVPETLKRNAKVVLKIWGIAIWAVHRVSWWKTGKLLGSGAKGQSHISRIVIIWFNGAGLMGYNGIIHDYSWLFMIINDY